MTTEAAIRQNMGGVEWAQLLTLSVLWGATYFFVAVAVDTYTPVIIVLARVALAALALNLLLLVLRKRLTVSVSLWREFVIMAFLSNLIPFSLMTWGQTHITGGLAAILNASTPLFAVIVAHWFTTDEKLTPGRVAGLAIGFAGVVVMIGISALSELGSQAFAQLAVVAGAFSFAVAGVFGRRIKRMGIDPLVTATGQLTASTVVLLPIAVRFGQPWIIASLITCFNGRLARAGGVLDGDGVHSVFRHPGIIGGGQFITGDSVVAGDCGVARLHVSR
jgi:drug/metabolite transporter (DMT)-like permease